MSKVIKQKFHTSYIVSICTDVLDVVLKDNHINCLGFTKSTVKSNDIGVV